MTSSHGILAAGLLCSLLAAAPASAQDASTTPSPLTIGVPHTVDTATFTVEPGEQNTTAPFAQDCLSGHPVGVARTAWFTVQGTGGPLTVSTAGSNYHTAMFVYAGSPAGTLVGCSDDAAGRTASLGFDAAAGTTYAIQVGRACSAVGPPTCEASPDAGVLTIVATG